MTGLAQGITLGNVLPPFKQSESTTNTQPATRTEVTTTTTSATDTVSAGDLTPKGLINEDSNYILQHDDIYSLLKYVCVGLILPQTPSQYEQRLQLSQDTAESISSVLQPLLTAYISVSRHCEAFRTRTYPGITGIAVDVFNYAQNAAGNDSAPYWAYGKSHFHAFSIRELSATDPSNQEAAKQTIRNLIQFHVTSIADIQSETQAAVIALRAFEAQAMADRQAIQECQKAVIARLDIEEGDVNSLEQALARDRIELVAEAAAYEHDKNVACSTPSYAWIPIFGMIAASAVATVYGRRAAVMARLIASAKELILNTEGELSDEKSLIADLSAIEANVGSLLGSVDPAVTVVEKMMGVWQAISDDLNALQASVDSDVGAANAALAQIIESKLTEKWNALATAVDKYRQASVISAAQMVSLEELSDQLSGRVVI
ncbi:hypothetical protein HDZ31DRAFT_86122 [Schizophyllum fasciatum]